MKIPLLKLDIKYNLPMFNGENDAKKLDGWVRKIEVYCRIQKLLGDEAKFNWPHCDLESLFLYGGRAKLKRFFLLKVRLFPHGMSLI